MELKSENTIYDTGEKENKGRIKDEKKAEELAHTEDKEGRDSALKRERRMEEEAKNEVYLDERNKAYLEIIENILNNKRWENIKKEIESTDRDGYPCILLPTFIYDGGSWEEPSGHWFINKEGIFDVKVHVSGSGAGNVDSNLSMDYINKKELSKIDFNNYDEFRPGKYISLPPDKYINANNGYDIIQAHRIDSIQVRKQYDLWSDESVIDADKIKSRLDEYSLKEQNEIKEKEDISSQKRSIVDSFK